MLGAFRKGKSFLLNLIIKYLENPDGWMESEDPIEGFSWLDGSEPVTEGILLWPRPFIKTTRNGQKVAVFIMDTQGAFDNER